MQREKMAGENLRDGLMEVAFEQWTERIVLNLSRLQRNPGVKGERYRKGSSSFPVLNECKEQSSLKLGGNTDVIFALSQNGLGLFFRPVYEGGRL